MNLKKFKLKKLLCGILVAVCTFGTIGINQSVLGWNGGGSSISSRFSDPNEYDRHTGYSPLGQIYVELASRERIDVDRAMEEVKDLLNRGADVNLAAHANGIQKTVFEYLVTYCVGSDKVHCEEADALICFAKTILEHCYRNQKVLRVRLEFINDILRFGGNPLWFDKEFVRGKYTSSISDLFENYRKSYPKLFVYK